MGPVHNALRHSTDLIRGVRRAIGLGSDDDGLERLSETLQLGASPWDIPEWSFNRQEGLFAGTASAAANAGTKSFAQLRVPAGSNFLAVVTKILLLGDPAASIRLDLSPATPAGGAGAKGWSRDTRANPGLGVATGAISVCTVIAGTDITGLGIPVTPIFLRVPLGEMLILDDSYIIHPGEALMVYGGVVNLAVTASFLWRERRAYPGELVA